MQPETILDIEFELSAPEYMKEEEVTAVIQDILAFVEEHVHELDDDATLDKFLNHCTEQKHPMVLVHQITKQIFEAMYGKEMIAELGEHGYAKKPSIN